MQGAFHSINLELCICRWRGRRRCLHHEAQMMGETIMATRDSNLFLTNDDLFMMAKGVWYRSYEKMGAHPAVDGGDKGYEFAVWAPDVRSVRVIGEFNGWDEGQPAHRARPVAACGRASSPASPRVSSTSTSSRPSRATCCTRPTRTPSRPSCPPAPPRARPRSTPTSGPTRHGWTSARRATT